MKKLLIYDLVYQANRVVPTERVWWSILQERCSWLGALRQIDFTKRSPDAFDRTFVAKEKPNDAKV